MKRGKRKMKKIFTLVLFACFAYGGIIYDVNGTMSDGATLSGTMTVAAGTVTAVGFNIGAPDSLLFTVLNNDVAFYDERRH
jgi:hypothetical protein